MVLHSFSQNEHIKKFAVYAGSLNSSRFSLTVNKFTTINTNPLLFNHVRYFSSIPSERLLERSQVSLRDITSEEINKLLVNQGVTISEEKLNKLKNIPGVKFDELAPPLMIKPLQLL